MTNTTVAEIKTPATTMAPANQSQGLESARIPLCGHLVAPGLLGHLPQHPHQHRSENLVLIAVDLELGSIHRAHIRFPNVTSVPLFARSSFETSRAFPTDSPPERREQQ